VNIYYLAEIRSVIDRSRALPGGVTIRPVAESDIPVLATTFLRSYGASVVAGLDEAAAEIRSVFDGTWGVPWPEASPAAWQGEELAGAVFSVRRPSMEMANAPSCPWLTDVFTDPRYRRGGIARGLLGAACRTMEAAGETRVGLTVDDKNDAAVSLYRSLGFTRATDSKAR
jgi:GNAT superfamily N-acetyltransferase